MLTLESANNVHQHFLSSAENIIVLHHDDADGYASALPLMLEYSSTPIQFIPVQYNQPVPNFERNNKTAIYVVDFSYSEEVLRGLNSSTLGVLVIDHHKTAQEALKNVEFCLYDMSLSGAELTWKAIKQKEEVPYLIKLVGDRDLWKFEYPESKALHAGIYDSGANHKSLEFWRSLLTNPMLLKKTIDRGRSLVEYIENKTKEFAKSSKWKKVIFHGVECALYNQVDNISEQASAIYSINGNPSVTLSYFIESKSNKIIFSMRSSKHSRIKVSDIAKKYGGGGHDNAAGFSMTLMDGASLLDQLHNISC